MSGFPPASDPGYFSDNPYQPPKLDPSNYPRRGLVGHVRVVAILNAVQGLLELLMAALYLGLGGMFTAMKDELVREATERGEPNPELFPTIMLTVMFIMGGGVVLIAAARVLAGYLNFYFQSRILGIISVCLGLASSFTCYCAATTIAIAVYSLIVFFNREVMEAFEMRAQGATADDVVRTFNARQL